ncbi:MAG: triple tyrosine motif-containing protein [Bacteroidota bacterium]
MQGKCKRKYALSLRLTIYFIVSPLLFFAQVQSYSFHHLNTDDGLSQASNNFIYKDSRGFLWLSSTDGLNRFDGQSVKVYKFIYGNSNSLLGNNISSNFYEDQHSNLWFTTNEGIHCYIRKQDRFQRFQIKDKEDSPIQGSYHAFHFEQNVLWVSVGLGNNGKLYQFNTSTFTSNFIRNIDGQRNYVLKDENGEIVQVVSAMLKNGIEVQTIWGGKERERFFNEEQKNLVNHITIEAENDWYLSTSKGMIWFDYPSNNSIVFNTYQEEPIGEVYHTNSINDSILLVATKRQSVLLFDKRHQLFVGQIPVQPSNKSSLSLAPVNTIYSDSLGNVWFSSKASGIDFTNLNKAKFDLPKAFLGERVTALFESNQREVFCSYGNNKVASFSKGITQFADGKHHGPDGEEVQPILFFFEDQRDTVWAITSNYLLKWNREKQFFEYYGALPSDVLYACSTSDRKLLLSTFDGIFEFKVEEEAASFSPMRQIGIYQRELATAIYEDKRKQKYLALDLSKVVILDDTGKKVAQIEEIGEVNSFYEEEHFLWVVTTKSILKINIDDYTVETLNEQNGGLPNETYYCIIPDEQNNFWLSSNKGIVRYNRNTKTYHRYTLADGLQGNEYNTNAFLKTQDGEIWMGGTNGLNRFYPEKIKSEIPLAKVQFTRLQINDEPAPDSINITMTEELTLAYNDNTLSFDFVGIDYSDPENVQLKYQMLGNDEDWIDAGNDGFARYSNLPFGNYTFQVKAANSDGVWSEEIKQLNIHIRRPWYRTWWFYLASILSISGLIYGIFMYRLRQALKIERMRVKISSDLHDDVGGLLSGLAMQSELLEMTAAEERKPKLQRISELSRNAMSRMRDTVWAIDARKDKLENLLDRIREHAAETLTPNDMRFDLQVEELALNKNMPTNIRQNLYLICKEAITNAAKHSNGDRVKIQFKKHGRNGIELTIHDNGKVLQKEHKTTGLGMSNMAMRAEEIGGRLELNTNNGFLIKVLCL